MRRFSLYKRGRIWYAQIYNPTTRKYLSGRPTGESDRRAAEHVADDWLRDGIPEPGGKQRRPTADAFEVSALLQAVRKAPLTPADAGKILSVLKDKFLIETSAVKAGPGAEGLVAFLRRFWDYDASPYVREKLAHGHTIGRRHCGDMAGWTRTCWEPFFKERHLGEIRKSDLKAFSLWLVEERKLKAKSINTALSAGTVALRWAHAEELIPSNPSAGLVKFSGVAARRGVLTEQEAKRVFEVPWADERARLGNILAMCTGLRAGEVLAVQVRDIGEDRLYVRHSWSNADALKSTKTGKERKVPLIASVRSALLDLAKKNPQGVGPTSFVFWSVDMPNRPMDFHFLLEGLKAALVVMSLTEEEQKDAEKVADARRYWKKRAVVVHSWRHLWAARMADKLEARKVMTGTGHSNAAVFEVYADHSTEETFQEVRSVAAETFGKLLPFKQ